MKGRPVAALAIMAVKVALATSPTTTDQVPTSLANQGDELNDLSLEELLELRESILEAKSKNLTYYIEESDDDDDYDDDDYLASYYPMADSADLYEDGVAEEQAEDSIKPKVDDHLESPPEATQDSATAEDEPKGD